MKKIKLLNLKVAKICKRNPLLSIIFLAFIIRLFAVFFSQGYLMHDDHFLVIIPPMIWNGFTSADDNIAVLANCSDIPHDKEEIIRLPYDDPKFSYKWRT